MARRNRERGPRVPSVQESRTELSQEATTQAARGLGETPIEKHLLLRTLAAEGRHAKEAVSKGFLGVFLALGYAFWPRLKEAFGKETWKKMGKTLADEIENISPFGK